MHDAEARLVSLIAARAALALENHAYQKELIASERLAALGTMAGMLAHDFRGPMTVIRGYAETLLEPGVPAPEVAARAALIVEATDRLARMTSETLDFARGAERLVLRPVSLGVFLAELAAGLEEELPGLEVAARLRRRRARAACRSTSTSCAAPCRTSRRTPATPWGAAARSRCAPGSSRRSRARPRRAA